MSLPRYKTMDASYQAGIAALAPYLDNSSLSAMSRVNSKFLAVFGRYLWTDPIRAIAKTRRPFGKSFVYRYLRDIDHPHSQDCQFPPGYKQEPCL